MLGVRLKRLKDRLPRRLHLWLRNCRGTVRQTSVLLNRVTDWSVLRNLHPYRPDFGFHYGRCIDRYYIERFLAANADAISGHIAEIGGDTYAKQFGGTQVERIDVLDIDERNQNATITFDLAEPHCAPESAFHCILCIQTLFEIYDHKSALNSLYRMLKPGGVVLVSLPGICQSVRGRMLGIGGKDYWRYTTSSAERMFAETFGQANVEVVAYGNVLTATALLHGLIDAELTDTELDYRDPDYEVTICVRATRSE
jgi:SAM-dependent methyltransferase